MKDLSKRVLALLVATLILLPIGLTSLRVGAVGGARNIEVTSNGCTRKVVKKEEVKWDPPRQPIDLVILQDTSKSFENTIGTVQQALKTLTEPVDPKDYDETKPKLIFTNNKDTTDRVMVNTFQGLDGYKLYDATDTADSHFSTLKERKDWGGSNKYNLVTSSLMSSKEEVRKAIDAFKVDGGTPTVPAIEDTVKKYNEIKGDMKNNRRTIFLLITDGIANGVRGNDGKVDIEYSDYRRKKLRNYFLSRGLEDTKQYPEASQNYLGRAKELKDSATKLQNLVKPNDGSVVVGFWEDLKLFKTLTAYGTAYEEGFGPTGVNTGDNRSVQSVFHDALKSIATKPQYYVNEQYNIQNFSKKILEAVGQALVKENVEGNFKITDGYKVDSIRINGKTVVDKVTDRSTQIKGTVKQTGNDVTVFVPDSIFSPGKTSFEYTLSRTAKADELSEEDEVDPPAGHQPRKEIIEAPKLAGTFKLGEFKSAKVGEEVDQIEVDKLEYCYPSSKKTITDNNRNNDIGEIADPLKLSKKKSYAAILDQANEEFTYTVDYNYNNIPYLFKENVLLTDPLDYRLEVVRVEASDTTGKVYNTRQVVKRDAAGRNRTVVVADVPKDNGSYEYLVLKKASLKITVRLKAEYQSEKDKAYLALLRENKGFGLVNQGSIMWNGSQDPNEEEHKKTEKVPSTIRRSNSVYVKPPLKTEVKKFVNDKQHHDLQTRREEFTYRVVTPWLGAAVSYTLEDKVVDELEIVPNTAKVTIGGASYPNQGATPVVTGQTVKLSLDKDQIDKINREVVKSGEASPDVVLTFKAKIKKNADLSKHDENGTIKIPNTADVILNGHDPITSNKVTVTPPTPEKPKKDVFSKGDLQTSIDGKPVKAGQELVYTITYENKVGEDVDVVITDTIPAHTKFVSADNGGTEQGGVITWTKKGVADKAKFEVTFTVQVDANVNGEVIKNKADVQDGVNKFTTNETHNPTGTQPKKDVFEEGKLTTSIDGKVVQPGQKLVYKVTYTNTTGKAQDVTITDTIPAHTKFVSADNGGTEQGGVITWTKKGVADKAKFEVTFTVQVDANVNGEVIKNKADVQDGVNKFTTNETHNPTGTQPKKDVFEEGKLTTSIDGKVVQPGQKLVYKVTYTNTTGKAQDVTITDTIPAHTKFVSADNGGTEQGGVITWTKKGVADKAKFEVTFTVQVDANVNGEVIKNKADVQDGVNKFTTNETHNPTGTQPKKDVFEEGKLTTSIDGKVVQPGQKLVYKVTYTNTTGKAQDVTITDTIPAHTKFVSADNGGTEQGGVITWTKKGVADKAKFEVTFTVQVDANVNGEVIKNKADVQDGVNKFTTNETHNPTGTQPKKDVFEEGKLTTSIDGKVVQPGQKLVYKVTYTNTTGKAQDVTITDTIPAHTKFVSADNGGTEQGGVITWTKKGVADKAKFEVTFTVQVDANVNGEVIKNKADVQDGVNKFTTNETHNPTGTQPKKDVFEEGKLTTSIDGKVVQPGQKLVYKVTYTNTTGKAQDVTITDTIPAHTKFVSADNGGTEQGGVITWTKKGVADKAKFEVTFTVQVDANVNGEVIKNKADVQDGVNKFTTNETHNPTGTQPKKDVFEEGKLTTSIDGKVVQPGQKLVYKVTYTNTTGKAQDVTITDTIPAHTKFVSADNGGTEQGGVITWTKKGVADKAKFEVTFTVQVDANVNGEVIKNKADVQDGVNKFTTNETHNPTGTQPKKDVFEEGKLTTSIDGKVVQPGQKLVYKVTYTNTTGKAQDVTITDTIPAHTKFVSADNGGTEQGGVITWTKKGVADKAKFEVTFTVQVDANVNGEVIKNKADVQDGVNKFTTNETHNPTGTQPKKDVFEEGKLTTSIDGKVVQPGQKLVYKVTYTNTTGKAQDVTITDTIPAHTKFVSADNGGTEQGGVITWTKKGVADKAKFEVTFTVQVDANVNGEVIKNKADVQDGVNKFTTNETHNPTGTQPKKDVFEEGKLTTSIDGKVVQPGQKLVYKVTYTNTTGKAQDVTITDTIPAHTKFVSADNGGTEQGGVITWTKKGVADKAKFEVTFTVQVDANVNGEVIKNKADVQDGVNKFTTNETHNPTGTQPKKDVFEEGKLTTSIDGKVVQPGQKLVYKVTYTNTTGKAQDVTITDTIPAHTKFVSADNGGTEQGGVITWTKKGVADKAKFEVTFTVQVDANVNGEVIKNKADVQDGVNKFTTNETHNPTGTQPKKDVFEEGKLTTSIDGKVVQPGQKLVYKVTYTNTTGKAQDVTITDTIPAHTKFVSADNGGTEQGGVITWTKKGVADKAKFEVTFTVQVDANVNGEVIKNKADVQDGVNKFTTNETHNPTGTQPKKDVFEEGKLTTSIDGKVVQPGQKLVYKVTYTNTTGKAQDVTITDTIPAHTKFVSADNGGTEQGGVITWTKKGVADKAKFEVTFTVQVDANVNGEVIKNKADVQDGVNKFTTNETHNPTGTQPKKDVFEEGKLTTSIDGKVVQPGQKLVYKVTYTNTTGKAQDVTITDTIPAHTKFVSADNGGTEQGGVITWTKKGVADKAKFEVTFTVQVDANVNGEVIKNKADVQDGVNKFTTNETHNPTGTQPKKDVFEEGKLTTSIDGKVVQPGQKLVYKVTYTNTTGKAQDVTITDTIPAHTKFVSADNGGTEQGGVITWTKKGVADKAKFEVTFTVQVDANVNGEVIKNKADVQDGVNKFTTNETHNPTGTQPKKDVFEEGKLTTSIDGKVVQPGQKLVYKVTYTNTTGKAQDVTITDTIPAHTKFVSADNGGTEQGGVITWTKKGVADKAKFEVTFTVQVDANVNGEVIKNKADVQDGVNKFTTNETHNPTGTQPKKDVFEEGKLTTSIDGKVVQPGQKLVYKVTYTNTTGKAQDVTITDTIPAHTKFVSADNGGTEQGGVITWTKKGVADKAKFEVTFTVQVDANVNGEVIKNKADVQDGVNKFTTNETHNPTGTQPKKDVFEEGKLTTSIDGKVVQPGQKLVYKVTYTNTTGKAQDVTITDTIPAHTKFVSADNGGTEQGGVITWTKKGVADKAKFEVTFTVQVDANVNGEVIKNKADVQDGVNKFTTNETHNPTGTQPKKDVFEEGKLTTSIDGKVVQPGQKLVYKVTYTNTTGKAQDVTITDTIPAHTKFVSADNGGTEQGGVITWTKKGVADKAKFEVTFTVQVDANVNGEVIKNKADVQDGVNKFTTNETHNPTGTQPKKDVFEEGKLTTSIDGKVVQPGQKLVYKVTYTNTTGKAQDVTITDTIPAHTKFVSADNGGTEQGGVITWTKKGVADKAKFEVTFTVQVDANVNGEVIKNKADVQDGVNKFTTNETHNPTGTQPKKDVFEEGKLTTSIDGKVVQPGQKLVYKVTYTNTTGKAQDVTITDTIPAHTKFVSADNGGTEQGGVITWTKKGVADKAKFEVTFTVQVDANVNGEVIKNKADVQDGVNKFTTNETHNPTGTQPKKDVFEEGKLTTSIDGKVVQPGQKLVYKVTYTNTTGKAQDVTITDTIPAHTKFVSADNGGTEQGGVITWTKKGVADKAKFEVTFTVQVDANVNGEVIKNKADVQDGVNKFTTNETHNPTGTQPKKDVFEEGKLTTSIDGKVVQPGQKLVYKVTYTNTTGKAQDVTITDTIPAHTKFVSADNGGTEQGGVITWTKKGVADKAKFEVTFTVQVDANVNGEVIKNKADVQDGVNKFTTNETHNPTGTQPKKDVFEEGKLTTSIDGKVVQPGQKLVYKVTYTNTTGKAQDVTITDTIPAHTKFVSADNGGTEQGGVITWTKKGVADKAKFEVTFTVQVDANVNGEVIKNKADVQDGVNKFTTNETHNPTGTQPKKDVFRGSDTTSINGQLVQPNEELRYTVTYTNTTGQVQDVVITDTVPAYTSFVSADNGGQNVDGTITWTKKGVANGETWTVSVIVKVDADVNKQVIDNIAHVKAGSHEADTNETHNPTPPVVTTTTATPTTTTEATTTVAPTTTTEATTTVAPTTTTEATTTVAPTTTTEATTTAAPTTTTEATTTVAPTTTTEATTTAAPTTTTEATTTAALTTTTEATTTTVAPTTTTEATTTAAPIPTTTTVEKPVLPKTGSTNNPLWMVTGFVVLVMGAGFILRSRKEY